MDTMISMPKNSSEKNPSKDDDGKLVKTATYDELLERVKRPTVQGGDTGTPGQLFCWS